VFVRYLVIAIVFGLLGTVIESVGMSVRKKRVVYVGDRFFYNLPVKPIYALGGLILLVVIKTMDGMPWYAAIILATLAVTVWEYFGGWFCMPVLGGRLWNYTPRGRHLHGHISLWSIKWWFALVTIFYFFIFNWFARLESTLEESVTVSKHLDFTLMIIFLAVMVLLTVMRRGTKESWVMNPPLGAGDV